MRVEIRDGTGAPNLSKVWNNLPRLSNFPTHKLILLYDCDNNVTHRDNGNLFKRGIPYQSDNPIQKGIENLFSKATLEKATEDNPQFINIDPERMGRNRGKDEIYPEEWTIDKNEKNNLCDWLCKNGTAEDFEKFPAIFEILNAILGDGEELTNGSK